MVERSLHPDLISALEKSLGNPGLIRTDPASRYLFSTDASIYRIEPFGVVYPRRLDDIAAIVGLCSEFNVPVIARGAGSGLSGQAIGHGLIIDCSRYLNRILEVNPESKIAILEPGVVLNDLNRVAARFGLQFGPDPASSERATIGGSIANNATGAHSIKYGMAADHIVELNMALSDGSTAIFNPKSDREIEIITNGQSREAEIYRAVGFIRDQYETDIYQKWPKVWRRASGYNLNYLLQWSPSRPPTWDSLDYPPSSPKGINLAQLIAGSEGTLGIIQKATVGLVSLPKESILVVIPYRSIPLACDAIPELLEKEPSAIELIPQSLIKLAKQIPAYANRFEFLSDNPEAILVIEFTGESREAVKAQANKLSGVVFIAETAEQQKQIWSVRKVGLGIIQSQPGDLKPISFIEDLSVPINTLGDFIREIERIVSYYQTKCEIYAHASAGCLHIRPFINLKDKNGIHTMRMIAQEAVDLTLRLGGSVSGEHGDGLARSEWLERMFGPRLMEAFRDLKRSADPKEILNPGKIVGLSPETNPPGMDTNLRFDADYKVDTWETVLSFEGQAGLDGAIEQCNGAGVCRKSEGVMCPSFQVSQDEMHSTRGRANLLRAMISGHFSSQEYSERMVFEAMDLCFACKGCKSECPSSVDIAKLKYEFLSHYYSTKPRKKRDYLFGYIGSLSKIGHRFSWLINPLFQSKFVKSNIEKHLEISQARTLPIFSPKSLSQFLGKSYKLKLNSNFTHTSNTVFFLTDAFTEYYYPKVGLAAIRTLERAGFRVGILPFLGSGRTLISKGFLEAARSHAMSLYSYLHKVDPGANFPIVGVEPSEIHSLRDEYPDLLRPTGVDYHLDQRSWMIDEFLIRPDHSGISPMRRILEIEGINYPNEKRKVLVHGHCYQKAQPPAKDGYPVGVDATSSLLKGFGYQVKVIDSSCCGMAGAFGYESDHYEFSMKAGELKLFPAIRNSEPDSDLAVSGVSCQAQIEDGTQKHAYHPIELVYKLLENKPA